MTLVEDPKIAGWLEDENGDLSRVIFKKDYDALLDKYLDTQDQLILSGLLHEAIYMSLCNQCQGEAEDAMVKVMQEWQDGDLTNL